MRGNDERSLRAELGRMKKSFAPKGKDADRSEAFSSASQLAGSFGLTSQQAFTNSVPSQLISRNSVPSQLISRNSVPSQLISGIDHGGSKLWGHYGSDSPHNLDTYTSPSFEGFGSGGSFGGGGASGSWDSGSDSSSSYDSGSSDSSSYND